MTMTRWQFHLAWVSAFVTGLTGVLLIFMEYTLEPTSDFSAVKHPWQQAMLEIHIISSPLFLFSLGYITVQHALRHYRENVKRAFKTGFSMLVLMAPMVITGYFIQTLSAEPALAIATWGHIVTGVLFLLLFWLHQYVAYPRRSLSASAVAVAFAAIGVLVFFLPLKLASNDSEPEGGESGPAIEIKDVKKQGVKSKNSSGLDREQHAGLPGSSPQLSKENTSTYEIERAEFATMGTWVGAWVAAGQTSVAQEALGIIEQTLNEFNELLSTYKNTSEITRINQARVNRWIKISNATFNLLKKSKEIARLTDGAFTPLPQSLVKKWGLDQPGSVKARLPAKKNCNV